MLKTLWCQALACTEDCPADATFVELGGDSITATELVARLTQQCGVAVSTDRLLADMTLADWLRLTPDTPSRSPLPPLLPAPDATNLPLSDSQRRMWMLQSFATDTSAYNVTFALRFRGPLDVDRLQHALDTVWQRHSAFRTRFAHADAHPTQTVTAELPATPSAQPAHDLSAMPPEEREARTLALLKAFAATPFDLAEPPLWRVIVIRQDANTHVLAWAIHHILIDLWGCLRLARELGQVYSGQTLPEPAEVDGHDVGAWQALPAVQQHWQSQRDAWVQRLQGLPPGQIHTDHPHTPAWYRDGGRLDVVLTPEQVAAIRQAARRHATTPFTVALTALALLITGESSVADIGIAIPVSARHIPGTDEMVASLVNTLVMRLQLPRHHTVRDAVQHAKTVALDAFSRPDLPFDALVEHLGAGQRLGDLPLGLQTMFSMSNIPSNDIAFEGLVTERLPFERGASQFPLTFALDLEITRILSLEYAGRLFERSRAQALLDRMVWLLDAVSSLPDASLRELLGPTPAEQAMLAQWEQGPAPAWPLATLQGLLRDTADALPTATQRFHTATGRCARAELEQRAHALAQHLIDAHGIGPGQRVALLLPREIELLVALRAVTLTGAAYLPLSPSLPPARLRELIEDAQPAVLLGDELADIAPPCLPVRAWPVEPPAAPRDYPVAQPGDAAYIIFTSGSTGRPKGVVVPQGAVANFLRSMVLAPGMTADDTVLAVTTLTFDISVLELMLPWVTGASVVLAHEDEVGDGLALARLIGTHGVSWMQATPASWTLLLDTGWQAPSGFTALTGGEALSRTLARRLLDAGVALWNMYGPTETTVWSTCGPITTPEAGIDIGRPIAHTRVRIVRPDDLSDCPLGTPGEILIEGAGVASGYWQRPELTADRFVDGRAYRTGDLGRWLPNGRLAHLGRLDHQIKVRGHRIEPGEIEARLRQHPDVDEAVVIAREDRPGDVRLVAYVVAPPTRQPDTVSLKNHLRQHLPDYMVPQHFIALAALPRLANGKLNRHELPPPAQAASTDNARSNLTPGQARVAAVWADLLGTQDIGPDDNFFDLGGHSLLAMQAISRLAQETGVRVNARRYIFESLAQLAAAYEEGAKAAGTPAAVQAANVPTAAPHPSWWQRMWRKA